MMQSADSVVNIHCNNCNALIASWTTPKLLVQRDEVFGGHGGC